jgi:nucleotide-binding universal stress UspA family protein
MARKILVGYDGTPQSEDAVCLAEGLAAITGAAVELKGVASGSPARVLREAAQVGSVDFIVVGSSHRGRLGTVLAGTTGIDLLNDAPCPVAVAPHGLADGPDWRPGTVGVAYDASPESKAALERASSLAHQARATLELITVAEPASTVEESVDPEMFALASRVDARDRLEAVRGVLRGQFTVVTRMLVGKPGPELVAASDRLDLLLVGSRGYGPAGRAFLGSVSAHLIGSCRCPLIVTPRGARVPVEAAANAEVAAFSRPVSRPR